MRKITRQIALAFLNGETCVIDNTETDGTCVWLHGNKIAEKVTEDSIRITLAGWNTKTTRERLNGIFEIFGVNAEIWQRNFKPVLCFEECREIISDSEWRTFKF